MQDNEEVKTEIGDYLKDKAESIVNLVNVLDKIKQGKIICRGTIKRDIESLIRDLCEEIFNEIN